MRFGCASGDVCDDIDQRNRCAGPDPDTNECIARATDDSRCTSSPREPATSPRRATASFCRATASFRGDDNDDDHHHDHDGADHRDRAATDTDDDVRHIYRAAADATTAQSAADCPDDYRAATRTTANGDGDSAATEAPAGDQPDSIAAYLLIRWRVHHKASSRALEPRPCARRRDRQRSNLAD